ncbi:hypothetical protein ACFY64_08865 [Streptomyces collinus]|uniref:hypothetical protein n=1 Tax=Streptomyces collinus TaxID=42684 RepID=UPI0036C1C15E
MADEQYRWLDRETAERLLSGEPPGAVEGAGRDQAEHLARTLGALSAKPPLTSDELPGEAAAVAAFRKARAERADATAARAVTGGQDAAGITDAGLVRIGTPGGSGGGTARRPRWARPARLALAAVLAVGMAGGVALATGTGALRAPFGGDEPDPGASVSAAATHPAPLVSPSPSDAVQGGSTPDDAPGGSSTGGSSVGGSGTQDRDERRDDAAPKPDDREGRSGDHREEITSACRDLRDGKRLDPDRRRALRDAADGLRVWKYCKGVLSSAGPRSGERRHDDRADQGRHHGEGADRDRDRKRDQDRKRDRKQDKAERKSDRQADPKADRKADQRSGKKGVPAPP